MKKELWKRGLALLMVCAAGISLMGAQACAENVPLTAGVFFLRAQEIVELPVDTAGASLITAEGSADLLSLCSAENFGQKDQAAVRQLAQKAISSLTKEERALFLNNFTGRIVPFCDGVLAGDEHCLNLLEDAGLQTQASWTEQDSGTESDQDRWEILKAAVLSLW